VTAGRRVAGSDAVGIYAYQDRCVRRSSPLQLNLINVESVLMATPLPTAGDSFPTPANCDRDPCGDACTLNRLAIGQRGTVVKIDADRELRRRLMEMGFCQGTCVEVVRRSPFGDPIELKLRGYSLSLRDDQARCVSVSPTTA
jgi:ferrous iron transport protein A